jgi:c-di-GMP-binding flagellar brake protein YcgR
LKKPNARKYPRVPSKFTVEYTVGDKKLRTRASTLGGGGLFLEKSQELTPGSEVAVRFRPAKHLPFVEARAKVCYVTPDQGAGLEFTELSPEHNQIILRLIHRKTANRRESPRAPLATQIQCEGCMALAFSRDVSTGGMFVETSIPCEVGTRVELRFHVNDGGPIIVTSAETKYIVPKLGMGVEFVDLSPSDRERLENYVKGSAASTSDETAQGGPKR